MHDYLVIDCKKCVDLSQNFTGYNVYNVLFVVHILKYGMCATCKLQQILFGFTCVIACSTDLDHLMQPFGVRVYNVLFVVQIYDTLWRTFI